MDKFTISILPTEDYTLIKVDSSNEVMDKGFIHRLHIVLNESGFDFDSWMDHEVNFTQIRESVSKLQISEIINEQFNPDCIIID